MICPISYEKCGSKKYSDKGLKILSRQLTGLKDFPYNAAQQRKEAIIRAEKMSIQGVQPKLSAILNIKKQVFEITDKGGKYILKPQSDAYPELPENEDLSMKLATAAGIEVPIHGLIYCKDGSLTYFIKRFDRIGRKDKLAVEDFAQLTNNSRETKYNYSMEKLILVLDEHCAFPVKEKIKFFRRCIFNYLIGNEDMHLKNFSLIRRNNLIELSPGYDFLSTTLTYQTMGKSIKDIEEIALPLKGKKHGLTKKIWLNNFAKERLNLNDKIIDKELNAIQNSFIEWNMLIDKSFLSNAAKLKYKKMIIQRCKILDMNSQIFDI